MSHKQRIMYLNGFPKKHQLSDIDLIDPGSIVQISSLSKENIDIRGRNRNNCAGYNSSTNSWFTQLTFNWPALYEL